MSQVTLSKHPYMFACSLILKMKAMCSSETSVNLYQTTRRHIRKETTLHWLPCSKYPCFYARCLLQATCSSETSVDFNELRDVVSYKIEAVKNFYSLPPITNCFIIILLLFRKWTIKFTADINSLWIAKTIHDSTPKRNSFLTKILVPVDLPLLKFCCLFWWLLHQ